MHLVPDNLGIFPSRPYFSNGEIDDLMDELLDSVRRPKLRGLAAIDIELVMLRLGVEPHYDHLPDGLEGLTLFSGDAQSKILISTHLADLAKVDPAALHRFRSTLGHEFGHSRLHTGLFLPRAHGRGKGFALPYMAACGRGAKYGGWWEWQANAAMAALLMPRREFEAASRQYNRVGAQDGGWAAVTYEAYLRDMSDEFQVSAQAVSYRAEGLGLIQPPSGAWT